jgi:hypothetical protein
VVAACLGQHAADPLDHRLRRIMRGGGELEAGERAVVAEAEDVGEGAAGVHRDDGGVVPVRV